MLDIENCITNLNEIRLEEANKLSLCSEGSMGPAYKLKTENFEIAMKCIKNSQHQKVLKD